MRRAYADELSELSTTYRSATTDPAADRLDIFGGTPAIFIASGGALAVARLAADLHQQATGSLAEVLTPLEFLGSTFDSRAAVTVVTARGKHPDVATVIDTARLLDHRSVQVITCRPLDALPPALVGDDLHIVSVASPPDGFLATNSVLAMATVLCRAYGNPVPSELPAFEAGPITVPRSNAIALTGARHAAVTGDFETWMSETGLATVQIADLRNFADGRHLGLHRHLGSTSVVAFDAPAFAALTDRTLGILPAETHIVRVTSPLSYPASVLDLLVGSMKLVGAAGIERGLDPGRPGVPPFGRELYRLPIRRLVPRAARTPIDRKVAAAGFGKDLAAHYGAALHGWLDEATSTDVTGVVLDYDGTCCSTAGRFDPPPSAIRLAIENLVESGVTIGFASGRGRSLCDQLRSWLPWSTWDQVHIGLYNASVMLMLSDDVGDYSSCEGDLAEAADRIEHLGMSLRVTRRRSQVTIDDSDPTLPAAAILSMVHAVLARPPALGCRAHASGHSVDVIAADATKAKMVFKLREQTGGSILAIGDQGQIGGNDFEMLAATSLSLSVDQCSADPTRGRWNLSDTGASGPELLATYLNAIKVGGGRGRFQWKAR